MDHYRERRTESLVLKVCELSWKNTLYLYLIRGRSKEIWEQKDTIDLQFKKKSFHCVPLVESELPLHSRCLVWKQESRNYSWNDQHPLPRAWQVWAAPSPPAPHGPSAIPPSPPPASQPQHPGRSSAMPQLLQQDAWEAIKVSVTAFVPVPLVSAEHKLRLLTAIFSTQVLHLIIEWGHHVFQEQSSYWHVILKPAFIRRDTCWLCTTK